jgi:general secretion pathway protein K
MRVDMAPRSFRGGIVSGQQDVGAAQCQPSTTGAQAGIALVAVLWMVAALSVLALALATATKSELHTAQGVRARAEAAAIGDAAIQLAVLELRSTPEQQQNFAHFAYEFAGREVEVAMVPASGLVDLNQATEALLAALFTETGGEEPEFAAELARRVVNWRTPGLTEQDGDYAAAGVGYRTRGGPFQYPEDLLQVLGVSYPLYDRVRDLITVRGGSAGVAPQAASEDVLTLLAGGDRELAARIAAARTDDPTTDMTGLATQFLGGGGAAVYRADARVQLGGRGYRRTRWIDLGQGGADGTPWRSFRAEPITGN